MRKTTAAAILISTALGCGGRLPAAEEAPGVADQPPPKVKQTRAFTGEDGLKVEVADLENGGALLRVSGVDSELAGLVFRYERRDEAPRLTYTTKWAGRSWNVLVREDSRFGGGARWTAYLPGTHRSGGFPLSYSEKDSAKVDVTALYRAHVEQQQRGALAALQRFDRAAEEAAEEEALKRELQEAIDACATPLDMRVAWDSVSDQQLMDKSVSGYCGHVVDALAQACAHEVGRRFAAARVRTIGCRLDGDGALTLTDGQLQWAVNFELYNLGDMARQALRSLPAASGAATLGEQLLVEQTAVCSDESGKHVLVVGPREAAHRGMAYGNQKRLFRVATSKMLSDGWFFDPRQRNERNNRSFRGYDLRYYSHVDVDREDPDGPCTLTCGARTVELRRLPPEESATLLAAVRFEPSPHGREPYALARDKTGRYYYVDRGATPETQKDFHLYRGKRGRMQALVMRDVVSDSEGEIFASDNGRLRLVVGRGDAQWIAGQQINKLKRLPLEENYGLIYNELGVYLGARLGVPCDDL